MGTVNVCEFAKTEGAPRKPGGGRVAYQQTKTDVAGVGSDRNKNECLQVPTKN